MGIISTSLLWLHQATPCSTAENNAAVTTQTKPRVFHPRLDSPALVATPLLPSQPTRHVPVSLPSDVIFGILSWLPVKSLCRFRCVSREWRAIISEPAFAAAHTSRVEPLLLADSNEELFLDSLFLFDMDGSVVKVIDDVGLVWMSACTSPDELVCVNDAMSTDASVIDLATGKVVFVTRPKDVVALGFGRASPSGVYKMVCLSSLWTGGHHFEAITVGDGAGGGWRRMQPPPASIAYYSDPVVVNGTVYFLGKDREVVLCFDLESEEWKKEIRGPSDAESRRHEINLGELNGALCMVRPEEDGCTSVWLLTDSDKGIWVKAYTIPLDPSVYLKMVPLRVLRDGRKLLFHYIVRSGQTIPKIYDPRSGTFTDVIKVLGDHSSIGLCMLHLERFV